MPKIIGTSNTIGSLATSFLSEAQFQALNGPTWVICAGQALPGGSKYFQITGLSNAPDVRGRAIAGKDNMNGSQAGILTAAVFGTNRNVLGGIGGTETHALSIGELAVHDHGGGSHTHNQQLYTDTPTGAQTAPAINANFTSGTVSIPPGTGAPNITVIASQGAGLAHPNTQPTMIANIFIKINP